MNLVINLNKPEGITSQQAVTHVKRLLRVKRAGHAGTLDPLATGVLLICTNEATKITRFITDLDKEYIAVMKLGEQTDTFDSDGEIIKKVEGFSFEDKEIESALRKFTGLIGQIPPMYSAVKVNGKPLYKLARKGIVVKRLPRQVMIHKIELIQFNHPLLEIKVSCSKGTYIRALCNDIGESLGVGAHVKELKRTRIGSFTAEDSITLDGLEQEIKSERLETSNDRKILSIDTALSHMREITLSDKESSMVRNGLSIRQPDELHISKGYIRLKDPVGRLFAIGRVADNSIRAERVFNS